MAPLRFDKEVLKPGLVHGCREFPGAIEMPLHTHSSAALSNPLAERRGRGTEAHDDDVGARHGRTVPIEVLSVFDDPRD